VSDPLTPPDPSPKRQAARPRLTAALVAGIVTVLIVGVVVLIRHPAATPAPGTRPGAAATPGSVITADGGARRLAVKALLARRARAVLDHDRGALLATIDPTEHRFAASQARMLADLRQVPLASWSYSIGRVRAAASAEASATYPVPSYAPVVSLHYRIKGFDTTATDLRQYPTFTLRGGHWYLASLDDFATDGSVSATDLWDYGPVDVVRRPDVLVLGPSSMLGTMQQVAGDLHASIPRVTSVWGADWSRRVVAEVPRTQRELGAITSDTGDLSKLAALSSAEISSTAGDPAPVGARVSVNPHTWPSVGPLGRLVVLTHELTHLASRADTGSQTPRWLQEGFADYVGFHGTGLAATVVAKELATQLRAGLVPRRLPADHSFAGSSPRLAESYEEGWLACRLIAARAGQPGLVRFYRQVGTATTSQARAVSDALHHVLHLSTAQFTGLWRSYLSNQLT
jgi:hypothetical protein